MRILSHETAQGTFDPQYLTFLQHSRSACSSDWIQHLWFGTVETSADPSAEGKQSACLNLSRQFIMESEVAAFVRNKC